MKLNADQCAEAIARYVRAAGFSFRTIKIEWHVRGSDLHCEVDLLDEPVDAVPVPGSGTHVSRFDVAQPPTIKKDYRG